MYNDAQPWRRHPSGILRLSVLMALVFGRLYALIEHLAPDSFRFAGPRPSHMDITPVSSLARSATIAEAFTGQIFLTVLVARLVGIHIANLSSR